MANSAKQAPINPAVLKWARESLLIDIDKAAKIANVKTEKYKEWEAGQSYPSISRLRNLSNLFKRPLPVFFMPQVPQESPIPTDFRSSSTSVDFPLTKDSILAIRKAGYYQSVAGELLSDLGYPIPQTSLINFNQQGIAEIVNDLRKMRIDTQFSWKDNWEALREWRHYLEDLGIFVFQESMPIDEIRGFSLVKDGYPPAIVINSKDSTNGRIFTLFHEYCHILTGEPGICIPQETEEHLVNQDINQEHVCNEFAGQFLVPTNHLKRVLGELPPKDTLGQISDLSKKFQVSRFVILQRLYKLDNIDYPTYRSLYKTLMQNIKKSKSQGGDFFRNQLAEKGKKFLSLVLEAESSKIISTSRALSILNIQLKHYPKITEMLYE